MLGHRNFLPVPGQQRGERNLRRDEAAPGAQGATAPRPSVAPGAALRGAKAKRADARARRLRAKKDSAAACQAAATVSTS
jgi:hypothetical protein